MFFRYTQAGRSVSIGGSGSDAVMCGVGLHPVSLSVKAETSDLFAI